MTSWIGRREFITLLGGSATAWPLVARAQQDGRMRRVGVLMPWDETEPEGQARFQALRQRLAEFGWLDGRNLLVDVRWAGLDVARQQSYARELVALAPEAIATSGTTNTQALRDATQIIPIVFIGLSDPVATGIVSNLARPDGNITGFMSFEHSLAGKWLSLLRDIAPRLTHVALLFNPDTAPWAPFYVQTAHDAGERLALKITQAGVRDSAGIEAAIAAIGATDNGGLLVLPDGSSLTNAATIIAFAAKYRVPAIYTSRPFVAYGGLMSYGTELRFAFRDGATYIDRILRGAKPGDLPVQFATKFELVINMKTAKALGLDVSRDLFSIADEVIE